MATRDRLPIRNEPPPQDDWLVLRGGPHSTSLIRSSALRALTRFDRLLVSVIIVPPPLLDHALRSRPLLRFQRVCWCLVREAREAELCILPTFDLPHFSVQIAFADDLTIGMFADTLNKQMENPYADR